MAIHPFHLASDCEGGVKTGLVISESNISCLFIVACPESLLLCRFFSSCSEQELLSNCSVRASPFLLLQSTGSRCLGFSSCITQAQYLQSTDLVAPQHVGFPQIRDRTCVSLCWQADSLPLSHQGSSKCLF